VNMVYWFTLRDLRGPGKLLRDIQDYVSSSCVGTVRWVLSGLDYDFNASNGTADLRVALASDNSVRFECGDITVVRHIFG
jgi:hypothetical protein